jgi:hypothetical protein
MRRMDACLVVMVSALTGPVLACATGCGGGGGEPTGGTGGTGTSTGGHGGQGGGTGGAPAKTPPTAGIDACHESFVDADGVCRPALAKCAVGTIPDVDKGCVPVGVTGCAPMFVDARGLCLPSAAMCAAGSYPVPSLGCVPVDGAGCGTGTWGGIPDAPENLYVDASYAGADSDGSLLKPYAGVDAALAVASDGDRLVLAAGAYKGAVTIGHAVEIVGVCPSKVTLTADSTATRVVTASAGAGGTATLRRLTVDAAVGGISVTSGDALIEDVVVQHVSFKAIEVTGTATTATVRRTLVADTTEGGAGGIGVGVQALGAKVTIEHSAVLRVRTGGLQSFNSGALDATDVFVGDVQADGAGNGDLAVASNGNLTLTASVLHGGKTGARAFKSAKLVMHGSVVAGTTDKTYGELVATVDAASVATVDGSALVDGASWGLSQYAGIATFSNNLIADLPGGPYGGLGIGSFGKLHSTHDVIARVSGVGAQLSAGATVEGMVVDGVAFDPVLKMSLGVSLGDPAVSTLTRSYVTGAENYGVQLVFNKSGKAGGAIVDRCLIEKITGRKGGAELGVGIGAIGPLTLEVKATRIADVGGAGIVSKDAQTTITGSHVLGVRTSALPTTDFPAPALATPGIGDGLLFYADLTGRGVTVTDTWFEGFTRAGLTLSSGMHTLSGVRAFGGQYGLVSQDGAIATQTDCDFSGNSTSAVLDPGALATPPMQ